MILTADIGNAVIKIGFFEAEGTLTRTFQMGTDLKRTGDEYVTVLLQLMAHAGIQKSSVTGIVLSCAVPQLLCIIADALHETFKIKPVKVGVGTRTGLRCKCDASHESGNHRIIGCVAAAKEYGTPLIVVDFGTMTTYNVVNEREEYLGGAITLGIKSTLESIGSLSVNLPKVEIKVLQNVVAQTTVQSIQSGVLYGAVGQVKYILEQIQRQMGFHAAKIIATGGLADVVNNIEPIFEHIDHNLSLKGLYEIYKLNS